MYTFKDRGEEEITLRPEYTAGIVRAILSNGLPQSLPFLRGPAATSLARLSDNLVSEQNPGQIAIAIVWAILWLAVLWFVPNTQQLMSQFQPALNYDGGNWLQRPPALYRIKHLLPLLRWRPSAIRAIVVGAAAALACLSLQHVSEIDAYEKTHTAAATMYEPVDVKYYSNGR